MPRIPIQVLSDLFNPHNLHDKKSLDNVRQWGGVDGLASILGTDKQQGIEGDENDIRQRKRQWGANNPIVKEPTTIFELIAEALEDKMLRILIAAAVISLIVGVIEEGWEEGWIEGGAILAAVITIVCVTAGNNYMKEKQFRKLNEEAETRNINVVRGGKTLNINIYELVVGDLVQITTGEILPVDGIVVQSNKILSDESSITGESDPIHKEPPIDFSNPKLDCFLISGSKIIEGSGYMLVCAVGENTQWGLIKKNLQQESDATPLQQKLAILADDIGNVGMYASIGTFTAMTLHLFVELIIDGESFFTLAVFDAILEHFVIAVTIIVVAVPEGLPLAVTISLAYSVGKMKDEHNLVRYLQACETMGGANNICSDKTGTLTMNKMTVQRFFAFQESLSKDSGDFKKENFNKNQDFLDILSTALCVNSSAFPVLKKKMVEGNWVQEFDQIGNKTECALIEFAWNLGFQYDKIRDKNRIQQIIEFSSARKKMTTVWKQDNNTFRIFTKGAADYILDKCTNYYDDKGVIREIDEPFLVKLNQAIKDYASASLRTLLIVYKDVESNKELGTDDEIESKGYTILGLAGIKDPLRPEIKDAVQKCKQASVIVRMVTGDVLETAVAISKDAGILPANFDLSQNDNYVMTGKDFKAQIGGILDKPTGEIDEKTKKPITVPEIKNFQRFQEIAKNLRVLARSAPEDKYMLVVGLKQMGNVIAVTGDGTNDAPALKKADVGFAMGIAGTEVAKEAAGIILLNDNFASIVTAMKWGRNIFESIRKFLQFQLTINCVALAMTFIGGITVRASPLNSIQMLWVNLIMDTMAALALATEPPSEELLRRKPYGRTEYIITPLMWRNIICQAVFQLVVLNIVLFLGDDIFGVPNQIGIDAWTFENGKHFTIFFSIFVFMQVFNEINARKLKREEINVFEGFFNNPLFLFIVLGTAIVHICLVELGGRAIQCSPLTLQQHLITIAIGSLSLIVGVFIKLIPDEWFQSISLFKVQKVTVAEDENIFNNPTMLRRKKSSIVASQTQGSVSRKDSQTLIAIRSKGSRDFSKKDN